MYTFDKFQYLFITLFWTSTPTVKQSILHCVPKKWR